MLKSQNKLNYIIQIDGLRCFAVIGVIIAHFISPEMSENFKKIPFGTGVNLFFVISGYLITFILLQRKVEIEKQTTNIYKELRNFFAKRILRIFPLYYLVLSILFIFSHKEIQGLAIYLLTFTTNIYMTLHNTYIGNKTHLWSLAVEEQFYLIWPFIIFFISKKWIQSFIFFIILFSLFSKYYFVTNNADIGANAFLTSCLDSLGLGALLAYLQINQPDFFQKLINKKYTLILVVVYIISYIIINPTTPFLNCLFENFFTSIIYFFIVGIASQNGFNRGVKTVLENKIIVYLGKISYGIYIIHNFIPQAFYAFFARKLPPTSDHGIRIFYWILLTVILASISWYCIEKPILKLKKRYTSD